VRLRSGDLFGFATAERTLEMADSIVVFPRVVPLAKLGLPARQPLGEMRARSWIFEDPSRIAGAREHRPGDSLRRIHWPASARAQRLQSTVYEATTSHKLVIFLNLSTTEMAWSYGYDPDILELGITTAASLARWGLERGYQVGLITNGLHWRRYGEVTVDVGGSADQMTRILLALGRLQPLARGSFQELLTQHSPRLPYGATTVAVTSAVFPGVASALQGLRARGHAVAVVLTGRTGVGAVLPGVTVRRVGPPEAWREAPTLSISADAPAIGR
jgi:uncharacterized protein (DUF58 family)